MTELEKDFPRDTEMMNTQPEGHTKVVEQSKSSQELSEEILSPSNSKQNPQSGTSLQEEKNKEADVRVDRIREGMLDRVAKSDGFFKHQQRGESDLTYEEKYEIAKNLLDSKTHVFLNQYKDYLEEQDLPYFERLKDDYIVAFHLKDIKERLAKLKNKTVVKNRRFEAMKELMDGGEYFGDEEMKSRDPLLYEQMVGQYLTEEEVKEEVDKSDLRFSTILLKNMDMTRNNIYYKIQQKIEDSQMVESGTSDSEDSSEEESELESEDEAPKPSATVTDDEKKMLRNEFLQTMQVRFLNGEDKGFDYSQVDKNVEYDSLAIREQDEQEKYFDEEDPESIEMSDEKCEDLNSKCSPME